MCGSALVLFPCRSPFHFILSIVLAVVFGLYNVSRSSELESINVYIPLRCCWILSEVDESVLLFRYISCLAVFDQISWRQMIMFWEWYDNGLEPLWLGLVVELV